MKISIDVKKGAEVVNGVIHGATAAGKMVVDNVHKGAVDLSEKVKKDGRLRRLEKLNPLFPERYHSEEFNVPNMIIIVDDAVRRDIVECEGAIGWLSNENGMEIMYLYDEAVCESGISFVPAPVCDTAYYVDRFDRNRFIQAEVIFSKVLEEKIAELEYIAYSLGAKFCSIEMCESNSELEDSKQNGKLVAKYSNLTNASPKMENESSRKSSAQINGHVEVKFEGSNKVIEPKLKWFKYDDTIKQLIEMRCNNGNAIKSKKLFLEGAASATMSKKTAKALDATMKKIGVGGNLNIEGKAIKEHQAKMIYYIEF